MTVFVKILSKNKQLAIETNKLFDLIRVHTSIDKEGILGNSGHVDVRHARIMCSTLMSHVLKMEHKAIAKEIDKTSPSVSYHTKQHLMLMRETSSYRNAYNAIKNDFEDFEDLEIVDRTPDVKKLMKEIEKMNNRITLIEAKI